MIDQSTVGHAQTFTTVDLPAVLADYHRPHPGVKIEFVESISVLVMQNLLRGIRHHLDSRSSPRSTDTDAPSIMIADIDSTLPPLISA
ncbi:hypothetical protein ACIGKQ_07965 [Gordonia sp. NPDC062954]|uniref:hypothetical protein n=1 Tax=Gordonia sp. NPDC062954 TaxID=3364003 RepID=UPI0037CBDBE2